MKTLSIVVPFFNEEPLFNCAENETPYARLKAVCEGLKDFDHELIFVNDGSRDKTLEILEGIAAKDQKVKVISFSRNFGHQAAVEAGLKEVTGNVCVIIDADMQDPPELIPAMLEKWAEGFDVVYGKRKSREGESKFKLLTAKGFYTILNKLSDVDIPKDTGDFRLVDRKVVDVMNSLPENNKFLRGLWSWIGFKQFAFEYERAERQAGVTHYPLKKMLKLASNGIFGFSHKPVTFIGLSGVVLMALAALFFLGVIISAIAGGGNTLVWVILAALNFIGSIMLIALFFLGKTLMMVFDNTNGRGMSVVGKKINC